MIESLVMAFLRKDDFQLHVRGERRRITPRGGESRGAPGSWQVDCATTTSSSRRLRPAPGPARPDTTPASSRGARATPRRPPTSCAPGSRTASSSAGRGPRSPTGSSSASTRPHLGHRRRPRDGRVVRERAPDGPTRTMVLATDHLLLTVLGEAGFVPEKAPWFTHHHLDLARLAPVPEVPGYRLRAVQPRRGRPRAPPATARPGRRPASTSASPRRRTTR